MKLIRDDMSNTVCHAYFHRVNSELNKHIEEEDCSPFRGSQLSKQLYHPFDQLNFPLPIDSPFSIHKSVRQAHAEGNIKQD